MEDCKHEKTHAESRESHTDGDANNSTFYTADVCDSCGEEVIK